MKNIFLFLLYICTFVYVEAYAEDIVFYQNSVTGREVKSTGTIEDYNRSELTLRTSSGNIISIKSDCIVDIVTDYPATYSEAELRMNNREYDLALPLLDKALVQAPDGWMKQKILSCQITCLINLNRIDDAAVRYVQLVQLDPDTVYYDSVPLVWTSVDLSARTEQLARVWIGQQKYPFAALLGASLLLTSDKNSEVKTALNALAKSEDSQVAILAQMQLNRLSLTPMSETALKNLEKKIDILPKSLQFGPRFVLAQLWSRSSSEEIKADKMTLDYLQCAVNPRAPAELQARAFYSAGSAALAAERRDEALRIFKKLIEKYPDSQWAQQAKRTIDGNL